MNEDKKTKLEMPVDPSAITSKMNSPEGEVFKVELQRYGELIAEAEYKLKKLKLYDYYKRLRFKEFLGEELTEEERANVEQLEEWIAIWEDKKGEN